MGMGLLSLGSGFTWFHLMNSWFRLVGESRRNWMLLDCIFLKIFRINTSTFHYTSVLFISPLPYNY